MICDKNSRRLINLYVSECFFHVHKAIPHYYWKIEEVDNNTIEMIYYERRSCLGFRPLRTNIERNSSNLECNTDSSHLREDT